MKYNSIFFTCFLISIANYNFSQEKKQTSAAQSVDESTYLDSELLNEAEKKEFKQFENAWYQREFPKLLAAAGKKKLGCQYGDECEALHAICLIKIDSTGKTTAVFLKNVVFCGEAEGGKLRAQFIKSITTYHFKKIKNKKLSFGLGHALKC